MEKNIDVKKVKNWFRGRETVIVSLDGSAPRWTADEICEILDRLAEGENDRIGERG